MGSSTAAVAAETDAAWSPRRIGGPVVVVAGSVVVVAGSVEVVVGSIFGFAQADASVPGSVAELRYLQDVSEPGLRCGVIWAVASTLGIVCHCGRLRTRPAARTLSVLSTERSVVARRGIAQPVVAAPPLHRIGLGGAR
jgi:hypothetical protein